MLQHPVDALVVESLSCSLGQRSVLAGLSLPPVPAGQLVALVGPNGSGKSTLLRSLAGLTRAHANTLKLGDVDLQGLPARQRARYLRYLPQALPGAIHLPVTEALMVATRLGHEHTNATAWQNAIRHTLRALSIEHLADHFLDELSGGQQQLVGLAQMLVNHPRALLLDEPLASLDLNYQHHVLQLLRTLCSESGLLIIVVLHDLNLALAYAQTILTLQNGHLAAAGEPGQVLTPPLLKRVFGVQAHVAHPPNLPSYLVVERPLTPDSHRND
jgi:iron complex transport system ATP-binding protein